MIVLIHCTGGPAPGGTSSSISSSSTRVPPGTGYPTQQTGACQNRARGVDLFDHFFFLRLTDNFVPTAEVREPLESPMHT
eukprot:44420-Rhodomonas_salina.1